MDSRLPIEERDRIGPNMCLPAPVFENRGVAAPRGSRCARTARLASSCKTTLEITERRLAEFLEDFIA
jgi:hypothetical protein